MSSRAVVIGMVGWFVATVVLLLAARFLGWWPLAVGAGIGVGLLPGFALFRLLGLTLHSAAAYLLFSFALSLLVLMVGGLATNQLLLAVGVARPLDFWGAFGGWTLVTAALVAASVFVNRTPFSVQYKATMPKPAWFLLALGVALPICAVLGAWRLNNGSDGTLALATIALGAILIGGTFVYRRRLPNSLVMWVVFAISLTILLMTSMRGWEVVGHDLQREFRVFSLTNIHGRWDMALDRDPYNACLSITVLPQMLSTLLGVSGIFVFKLLLQLAFAACPVIVYMLLRHYVSTLGALAGSLLFICYPTFINDAAMLTRQGMGYLFFALAILLLSSKVQSWQHKTLFLLCSLGAIVSHYSTAYMFVALFGLAAIGKTALNWHMRKRGERTILSPVYAFLLFMMAFLWYTQITETSGGLTATLQKSFGNIPSLFSEDHKSTDTSSALFFSTQKTQVDLYQDYLSTAPAQPLPEPTPGRELEVLPALTADELPVTPLGEQARQWGVDLSFPTTLRQQFARVLQVLAIAGVVYTLYRLLRGRPMPFSADFVFLSCAGMAVLALLVVLPVLSVNYGVLRAFQQILIFLVLPMVFLLAAVIRRLPRKPVVGTVAVGIVGIFLLFTGAAAQVLGGSSPSLTMNNAGLYFGLYYSSAADQAAFSWLKQHVPPTADVRSANPNRALMYDPSYPFKRTGILPLQTTPDSYIYADQAQHVANKLYVYYESSPLVMTFPLDYFKAAENQLYSTATTGIYQ